MGRRMLTFHVTFQSPSKCLVLVRAVPLPTLAVEAGRNRVLLCVSGGVPPVSDPRSSYDRYTDDTARGTQHLTRPTDQIPTNNTYALQGRQIPDLYDLHDLHGLHGL